MGYPAVFISCLFYISILICDPQRRNQAEVARYRCLEIEKNHRIVIFTPFLLFFKFGISDYSSIVCEILKQ